MSQRTTVVDWAPYAGVSVFRRVFSICRSIFVMLVTENPILWRLGYLGKNVFEDIEGPFYLVGSPDRQIEDGKAVLASAEELTKHDPFLFVLDVKDTKGDPVPYAALDLWQANTQGYYAYASWALRGRAKADAYGHVEILTVRPGDYAGRAAHIHIMASGGKGVHAPMTTQAYVCPGNKPAHMSTEVANFWRPRKDGNVVACWSVRPSGDGELYYGFPALPDGRNDLKSSLGWWEAKLKERGLDRELVAVGHHTIALTKV